MIITQKELPARNEFDFYPTPIPFCKRALSLLPQSFAPKAILDPGAGDGNWGIAARTLWADTFIEGVELREIPRPSSYVYDAWHTLDFRLWQTWKGYDLIMGNPPYIHAETFIREGFKYLHEGGYLMFLLRLAFLEGQGRAKGLYRKFSLHTCHVAGRVSFTGNGKTNATAYGLFVWQKGYQGETKLSWELMR